MPDPKHRLQYVDKGPETQAAIDTLKEVYSERDTLAERLRAAEARLETAETRLGHSLCDRCLCGWHEHRRSDGGLECPRGTGKASPRELAATIRALPLAADTVNGARQRWMRENAARAAENLEPLPWPEQPGHRGRLAALGLRWAIRFRGIYVLACRRKERAEQLLEGARQQTPMQPDDVMELVDLCSTAPSGGLPTAAAEAVPPPTTLKGPAVSLGDGGATFPDGGSQ